jgi:hypothetical protein
LSPTPTNTVTTTVSTNPPSANVRKTNNGIHFSIRSTSEPGSAWWPTPVAFAGDGAEIVAKLSVEQA